MLAKHRLVSAFYALLEYFAIMNLPYEQRFKCENIILVGTIPGPTEPHGDLN